MNIYPFAKFISYPWVRLTYRMTYEGLEHIPKEGGYILSGNHTSLLDPIVIVHKVPHRVCYIGKSEYFHNKFLNWLFTALGAFPVERGTGDRGALRRAERVLARGEILGIFPEGTRSRDGSLLKPKAGVAMIAGMAGCGILPVGISIGKKTFRRKITVRYGPMLTKEELAIDPRSTASLRGASERIMAAIGSLKLHTDRRTR